MALNLAQLTEELTTGLFLQRASYKQQVRYNLFKSLSQKPTTLDWNYCFKISINTQI